MSVQSFQLKSLHSLEVLIKASPKAQFAALKMPELQATQAQKLPCSKLPFILLWKNEIAS